MHARFNEYLTIARKKENDWWIGSLNNSVARDLRLSLEFLDDGQSYIAEIYTDDVGKDANHLNYKERSPRKILFN